MNRANLQVKHYIILIAFSMLLFFIIAIFSVSPKTYLDSDFFSYWLAGRLAFLGKNPYDSKIWIDSHYQFGASWISDNTFLYPQPLSLLFLPFGVLPLYQAFVLWVTLSQLMITSAFILLFGIYSNSSMKRFILPLSAGIVLFRPIYPTLLNGQLSGLLLLVVSAIIYMWEKGKWKQGASLMAILALKPNIGLP